MVWDKETNYILYVEYVEYIKSSLGIKQLDIDIDRDVLLPYHVQILHYINYNLVVLATDNIKEKINKIFELYRHGADLICDKKSLDLAKEVLKDDRIDEDENFDLERFVFSWSNFLTSLCLRLKFQYDYLFKPEKKHCPCDCYPSGQTVKDFESWVSNVFPEDEPFDRTNYTRTNSPWEVSKDRYCACYRHDGSDSEE